MKKQKQKGFNSGPVSHFLKRSSTIPKRKGIKFVKSLPSDDHIVSMINFKDRIILATTNGVYEIREKKIHKIFPQS